MLCGPASGRHPWHHRLVRADLLAGTMGGLHTEIDSGSTDLVIEGAHFDALGIARGSPARPARLPAVSARCGS